MFDAVSVSKNKHQTNFAQSTITVSNLYTQIDGYVQKNQFWGVQVHHVHKHSHTNLRFYLIL